MATTAKRRTLLDFFQSENSDRSSVTSETISTDGKTHNNREVTKNNNDVDKTETSVESTVTTEQKRKRKYTFQSEWKSTRPWLDLNEKRKMIIIQVV